MPTLLMRPAGALGDNSTSTYETATGPDPAVAPPSVTLDVTAASLTPSGDLGHITSVTLGATVRWVSETVTIQAQYLIWTDTAGGTVATIVPADAFGTAEFVSCTSEVYTLNPWTGLTWAWNDLNSLSELGARLKYSCRLIDGEYGTNPLLLHVGDVWVSVDYTARAEPQNANKVNLSCKPRMMDFRDGDTAAALGVKPRGIDLAMGSIALALMVHPAGGGPIWITPGKHSIPLAAWNWFDGGEPDDEWDDVIEGGNPSDVFTLTIDGGTP